MDKTQFTRQLTQYNEVIAETKEYQPASRSSVSLKNNVKIPPRSCAVVDVDVNTTVQIRVEIQPDELWLNSNPNICTYPLVADLKEKKEGNTTPFIIVNFSHHEYLHLPKDHMVAFVEKDCTEGEVLELCTMEQLEQELPRNWIPKRKMDEKITELLENPFMRKKDDFLKSQLMCQNIARYYWRTKIFPPKQRQHSINCVRNMMISYPKTVATY